MNRIKSFARTIIGPVAILAALALLWVFRTQIFQLSKEGGDLAGMPKKEVVEKQTVLEISERARKNLGLIAQAAKPTTYWRSIVIPGEIADRPGISDRGVTSPAVGIVAAIHAYPGDTVVPGESMFTLRLFSEYLQNTQSELFKATQEVQLVQQEINRLADVSRSGAVPANRTIELNQQLNRQVTLIRAYEQDLLTRGLNPDQVKQVASGTFVSTIEVSAPPAIQAQATIAPPTSSPIRKVSTSSADTVPPVVGFEVQELSVELGQQVQAGELLAQLSNHQSLYVVGHAFKKDAEFLERAAIEGRDISIEFSEDSNKQWPALNQTFSIRHLANTIDRSNRTFNFFVPLTNQFQAFENASNTFLVWRFRPGQRARISVPVEKFENVFVLPSEGVVRVGPEAYVFRQNGDLFKQLSVNILHEDRRSVVIANDGAIPPGSFIASNSAASLNRVLKAQSASGQQPGVHVHADGTTHAAH